MSDKKLQRYEHPDQKQFSSSAPPITFPALLSVSAYSKINVKMKSLSHCFAQAMRIILFYIRSSFEEVCYSLVKLQFLTGCPTLPEAEYRSIRTYTVSRSNNVKILFECESWTDLIGPKNNTCSYQSGKWSHTLSPICQRKWPAGGTRSMVTQQISIHTRFRK